MPFPLAESFVLEAERQLGACLPESYRNALMRSNGGTVEDGDEDWELHPIADTSDRKRLARTASHLIHETNVARTRSRFPPEAIAIATGMAGDHLVLRIVAGTIEPAILAWDHETGSLKQVAADFAELTLTNLGGGGLTRTS